MIVINIVCFGYIWIFFFLGEIEKCGSVIRKICEIDSLLEESEGGEDKGGKELVEVEEEEY